MSFTFAFHYEVKCPDTPGGFRQPMREWVTEEELGERKGLRVTS